MAELAHPQSPHAARRCAFPLAGGIAVTGETPATAIAGVACSAAAWLFGFHALRVVRSAMDN